MKKGFTLIELLVVIAIIAILAAILFPVFAQAREKARSSACLSNTKQIGTALQLYSDDYDETLPLVFVKFDQNGCEKGTPGYSYIFDNCGIGKGNFMTTWMDGIFPYVKNLGIFVCPSLKVKMNAGKCPKEPVASYSVNVNVFNNDGWNTTLPLLKNGTIVDTVSLSQIKSTSNFIFCLDGRVTTGNYNYNYPIIGAGQIKYYRTDTKLGSNVLRHNDGANFTFSDGHAKYFKYIKGNPAFTESNGWGDQADAKTYWRPEG